MIRDVYSRLMKYFALTYDVVENFAQRRMPFRGSHLKMVQDAHERGEIVMAGALGDPSQKALIVFRATDVVVAERFAENDPYVTNGLVKSWSVHPWNVVIGGAAGSRGIGRQELRPKGRRCMQIICATPFSLG